MVRHCDLWDPGAEGGAELISGLNRTVDSFSEFCELRLYFNRNVNPFLFFFGKLQRDRTGRARRARDRVFLSGHG